MKEKKHARLLEFPQLGDERGHLVVVEGDPKGLLYLWF